VTERDVQGALRRAKTNRTGMMDLTVDAPRNWLTVRLIEAFDDRATLAAEVERLTQLHAARPPYTMTSYPPGELAEILERDMAIIGDFLSRRADPDETREDVT
jgi:hypothetical protein